MVLEIWPYLERKLGIAEVRAQLTRLENAMGTQAEALAELGNRFDQLGTVVGDIAADFAAFRTAMEAEREELSEAGVAALDEANAKADATTQKLADLDVSVGDADGSDTPPVEPPVEQ